MPEDVNWEAVRLDVGAGLTYREIGAKHGVSAATICKRAKKEEWPRDLSRRIKERAERNVLIAETAKQRNARAGVSRPVSYANENEMIQAEAGMRSAVIMQQREDAAIPVQIAKGMLMELLALQDESLREVLGRIAEARMLSFGDGKEAQALVQALERALDAAISLPGRAKTAQIITATFVQSGEWQRKVLSIDKDVEPDDPWRALLDFVAGHGKPHVAVQINNAPAVQLPPSSPYVREVE